MTRGTGYLLMKDRYLASTEFNGDMYPTGLGDEFMRGMQKCNDAGQFISFIEKFNKAYHQYNDQLIYEGDNSSLYEQETNLLVINFNRDYCKRFFSDWVFFKNLTGKPVQFTTCDESDNKIILGINKSARFKFGYKESSL